MGSDEMAKANAIQANLPAGLVRLIFLQKPNPAFEYYVRHPVSSGPQAMLGVRELSVDFKFPDSCGYTPLQLRAGVNSRGSISLPELRFTLALTVLPKPLPAWLAGAGVVVEPVLLVALSLATIQFEAQVRELKSDRGFIASIPTSLNDPPYRNAQDKKLVSKLKGALPRNEKEDNDMALSPDFHPQVIQYSCWKPWILDERLIPSERWQKHWAILKRWRRWANLTHRERAYDLAKTPTGTPALQGAFQGEGDRLRKFCERCGL